MNLVVLSSDLNNFPMTLQQVDRSYADNGTSNDSPIVVKNSQSPEPSPSHYSAPK